MKLHLRVVTGMQIGDQSRVEAPGGVIGRQEGCALHLRDESVSRSHMELSYQQDGWWAFQRSARSPSLVDGVPLTGGPLALRRQGVLQVGGVAIEYSHEDAPKGTDEPDSPATMINIRRQLPTIQHAVLPQMTPMRAAEPSADVAPATLILRRQPPPAREEEAERSAPAPAVAQLEAERDRLRSERERLEQELRSARQECDALRQAQTTAAPAAPSRLPEQALLLLAPFGDSLEQALQALSAGDAAKARALIREASFALADLRDLFETAGS